MFRLSDLVTADAGVTAGKNQANSVSFAVEVLVSQILILQGIAHDNQRIAFVDSVVFNFNISLNALLIFRLARPVGAFALPYVSVRHRLYLHPFGCPPLRNTNRLYSYSHTGIIVERSPVQSFAADCPFSGT